MYFITFKKLDNHVLKNQVNTQIIHDYNKAGARFWLIITSLFKIGCKKSTSVKPLELANSFKNKKSKEPK
jgi:hypothetical protein